MNEIEKFKVKLKELGYNEKKKNNFSKVYTKSYKDEENNALVKIETSIIYRFTPKFVEQIFVDSTGRGTVQSKCRLSKLNTEDTSNWKAYKGTKKSKKYDFNKL